MRIKFEKINTFIPGGSKRSYVLKTNLQLKAAGLFKYV